MQPFRLILLLLCTALISIRAATAQVETITVSGPTDRIEILYDDWGVPHIYASSLYDLFFAQGYAQARDRWWQMEWFRRIGYGRLSEVAGRGTLDRDILLRTIGAYQTVAQELEEIYTDEIYDQLQAFADGVNTFIGDRTPGAVAMEYAALRLAGVELQIEPWTPADTLIWGKVMAFGLGGNMDLELLISALVDHLGEAMFEEYVPPFPYDDKPTILWADDVPITPQSLQAALQADTAGVRGVQTALAGGAAPGLDIGLGHGPGLGSNNWVVSGALTASGLPLLANDTHLGIQMPSIWYEVGLHCRPLNTGCPLNVVGFTFSPSPGVIIGHNDRIAWGVTNAGNDVQDLYLIRVNPDNPLQYEYNGQWRDMTTREEVFGLAGSSETVTIQVRETHFGPIINDNAIINGEPQGFNNENPLALRWAALEPGTLFRAVSLLNRAGNWDEFRQAVRYWDTPSQNFVYADIDNNIGYQLPGRVVVRAGGHTGLLPVPGWTDEYEWRGYIPFDYLPRILNPQRGYIATANQAIVPLDYYDQLAAELSGTFGADASYRIGYLFAYGYRGKRINQLIETLAPHTWQTFQQIHGDNKSLMAEELLPYLAAITISDEALAEVHNWLLDWDYQMHMDSPQAALYAHFWARLVDNLFNDRLAPVYQSNGSDNVPWAARLLMDDPSNPWWDDLRTPQIETRDEILLRAFAQAYESAVADLGEDRAGWRWGDLHTATFINDPLGRSGIAMVEAQVNRGPVRTSGGSNIVNATGWNTSSGHFRVNSLPAMRIIVDLADFDGSKGIHTTGQSGNPYSPHYDDMIDHWRGIDYHPLWWSRAQVEAAAASRLELIPLD